jgi:hypothetical protein
MSSAADVGRVLLLAAKVVLGVVGAFSLVALASFLGSIVSGTFLRAVIAAAMGLGIAIFGIGYFRQFANPPPPDPEPADVPPEFGLAYVCEMCGLELSVIRASKEKAPKHCGEEMILVARGI